MTVSIQEYGNFRCSFLKTCNFYPCSPHILINIFDPFIFFHFWKWHSWDFGKKLYLILWHLFNSNDSISVVCWWCIYIKSLSFGMIKMLLYIYFIFIAISMSIYLPYRGNDYVREPLLLFNAIRCQLGKTGHRYSTVNCSVSMRAKWDNEGVWD